MVGDNISTLHATSAGRALLGSLEEPALNAFLKSAKLVPRTTKTILSAAALRKDVELGRKEAVSQPRREPRRCNDSIGDAEVEWLALYRYHRWAVLAH